MAVNYKDFSRYTVTENGKVYGIKGERMNTFIDRDGYEVVGLRSDEGKKYIVKVHRLVATKYIPTEDYSLTVNHKDGNKLNNTVNNLEWMTSSDNLKHAWSVLKRPHASKPIRNSKGEVFESAKEAAQKYNIGLQAISNCARGITKTCMGMKWRYI